MVNESGFDSHAKELLCLRNQVKIGLHFNLTEGYLLSQPGTPCFTLNELLIRSHLRLMNRSSIANEFLAQLEHFINAMQMLPDFIDGHQHVHQFPQIRQVILEIYEQKLRENGTVIRSTWPSIHSPHDQFKARILGLTGGMFLKKQLVQSEIPHNPCFSGVYDFSPKTNYRMLFRAWLDRIKEDTLIMCHPGVGECSTDPIARARSNEFNYFSSDDFLNDCDEFHVQLALHDRCTPLA